MTSAQWLILRKYVKTAWWWIVVSIVGSVLGFTVSWRTVLAVSHSLFFGLDFVVWGAMVWGIWGGVFAFLQALCLCSLRSAGSLQAQSSQAQHHVSRKRPRRFIYAAVTGLVVLVGTTFLFVRSNDEGKEILATAQNRWLFESATERKGDTPASGKVEYTEPDGTPRTVEAIPGEVIVIFDPAPDLEAARKLIRENGGRIRARIPKAGSYLVSTGKGEEGAVIKRLYESTANLLDAKPNGVFSWGEVTILDQFSPYGNHGDMVRQVLEANGGKTGRTRNVDDKGKPSAWRYLNEFYKEVSLHNPGDTILVNLSVYGETVDQQTMLLRQIASAVHLLPEERKKNLALAVIAGNSKLDLKPVLKAVRKDPRMETALREHVLIVTTNQKNPTRGEFASRVKDPAGDPDVVAIDNPEAQNGTSFAAPAAIGRIDQTIRETGLDARTVVTGTKQVIKATRGQKDSKGNLIPEAKVDEVTKAIKWAKEANANKKFFPNEGADKASALTKTRGEPTVTDISFVSVGAYTLAIVRPAKPGVSVHRTVSGTDRYYASDVRVTNDAGQVSFQIPKAKRGVVDTITVTAVGIPLCIVPKGTEVLALEERDQDEARTIQQRADRGHFAGGREGRDAHH